MFPIVGKFCVFLHHYAAPLVALWSLMLNSYMRKEDLRRCNELAKLLNLTFIENHNRPTQLLNATGIEGGIHDCQFLIYQPSVTSRVIFHHLIPLIIIKYQYISLDVTDG